MHWWVEIFCVLFFKGAEFQESPLSAEVLVLISTPNLISDLHQG